MMTEHHIAKSINTMPSIDIARFRCLGYTGTVIVAYGEKAVYEVSRTQPGLLLMADQVREPINSILITAISSLSWDICCPSLVSSTYLTHSG